jgi:glycosyltransferase involved in cell wall biosynthesis
MATVSILIPTYNCAALLERAVRSVAAQTLAPEAMQVVIVDDGSSDDTAERVAALQRELALPILYERQANAGPSAARNRALASAGGEFIAFLDADDVWLPEKLQRQLALFDDPRTGLVYCDVAFVDAAGRAIADYPRRIHLTSGDIVLSLFLDFFLLTSAVVMRRELARRENGFREDLPVGEDYDFFLRALRHCDAGVVGEKLLLRTVRPDSLSRQNYALDADVDLATLQRFASENPAFAARNAAAIRRRIADYHSDYAWSLLRNGRRRAAARQALHSIGAQPSLSALKTLVRTCLP